MNRRLLWAGYGLGVIGMQSALLVSGRRALDENPMVVNVPPEQRELVINMAMGKLAVRALPVSLAWPLTLPVACIYAAYTD